MKYENVVWDWNGTLLDDVRVSVGAINRMLERRGIPGLTVERYRDIFGFPVRDYYESIGFDFARDDWDGVSREFVQDYDALATDVQLTEGEKSDIIPVCKNKNLGENLCSRNIGRA